MSLKRYEIIRELGEGTCGKTFLATDTGLPSNRLCVIKQLKPRINSPKTYEIIRDRFMAEARVLEKLGREVDQIPELYEFITHNDEIYLVQEWVEGKTLKEFVLENGVLQASEVLSIVGSLLQVLNTVYAKGVIHRDINPNNIILRVKDSLPVLIDFGLVKEVATTIVDSHGTPQKLSIIVGTEGYIAPEQGAGKPVFASDLYSLGMTAIHLLTGKHPFELGDSSDLGTSWLKYAPTVGTDFASVIAKATETNYLHRYANAAEMLEAVSSCAKQVFPAKSGSGARTLIFDNGNDGAVEHRALANSIPELLNDKQLDPIAALPAIEKAGVVDLAVEIGRNTIIYRKDVGVVVSEPSILALNKLTRAVEAVGTQAEDSLLLATSNLEIVHPIEGGKVADRKLTSKMLQHFFNKACGGVSPIHQRVVIAIPSELTAIERRAFIDAAYGAQAAEVYLVERIIGAAIGVGISTDATKGNMFVHVGESATDIVAISAGRRHAQKAVNVGVDLMKEAIKFYVKRTHNLLIGEKTAATIYLALGSAYPLDEAQSLEVSGRNLVEGIPRTVTLTDTDVREALADEIQTIILATRSALERTPPEISADIIEQGIVLTGSGSRLKKLDRRLSIETGVTVNLAKDPTLCVVAGAARMIAEGKLRLEEKLKVYEFIDGTAGLLPSAIRTVLSLISRDLAIDMGTGNSLVYAKGYGIVVSEPSLVAINSFTHNVEAFGHDAKALLGRSTPNMVPHRPVIDGAIADSEIAGRLLGYLIRKAHHGRNWVSPRLVMTIPAFLTKVEREAFENAAYQANAAEVWLIEQPLMAALGSGVSIEEPHGNMIVDIGSSTTDIAVVSLSGIVYARAIRVAGNQMDDAIISYIKRKYNLLIGERTAEAIKIELGSAYPIDEPLSYEVRGRNLIEGIPKTITLSDEEVREALADSIVTIVNALRVALERIPPELSADIVERGIVLTGGGALLKNLDKRISIETGLPTSVADDPLASVILGAGKLLSDRDLLRHVRSQMDH